MIDKPEVDAGRKAWEYKCFPIVACAVLVEKFIDSISAVGDGLYYVDEERLNDARLAVEQIFFMEPSDDMPEEVKSFVCSAMHFLPLSRRLIATVYGSSDCGYVLDESVYRMAKIALGKFCGKFAAAKKTGRIASADEYLAYMGAAVPSNS